MAIVDVIKWNGDPDTLAWKYPSEELGTWTQMIVAESQEAFLFKGGQPVGPFTAGRHTLDTANYPVLGQILKIATGGRSPFTAEVWYVNKVVSLDVKWGTPTAIQALDPQYRIMLPVRAYGQLGLQVVDSGKFLVKLVGTLGTFDRERFNNYFRGVIVTRAKDAVATLLTTKKISILEISAHLNEISDALKAELTPELEEFGLGLTKFFVNSIDTPEDDPAVARLKSALARKAEMDIVGYNYQQERTFDTLQEAAGNTGAPGTVMGAGLGLGMGLGAGPAFGGAMAAMGNQLQPQNQGAPCPKCQAANPAGAKFCVACGGGLGAVATIACPACQVASPATAAFCIGCGGALKPKCGKCSAQLPAGAKFCLDCGTPVTKA
jgi:membrane protease subunit (stomatin/prohibitin family)